MKILFVYPEFPDTFWSFKHALKFIRKKAGAPPLGLLTVTAMPWTYDVNRLGFRYHMGNLHAAVGLAQLARMPAITARRQQACRLYNQKLAEVRQVRTPLSDFSDVTPFLYYIRVPADHRQPLRDYLKHQGIDTGIHWQPGHWFSLLKDARRGDMSVTEQVGHEILSLPLSSQITDDEVALICESIATYFRSAA